MPILYAGESGYNWFKSHICSCDRDSELGGIVFDSDPEKEFQETINKAKAIVKAAEDSYNYPSLWFSLLIITIVLLLIFIIILVKLVHKWSFIEMIKSTLKKS